MSASSSRTRGETSILLTSPRRTAKDDSVLGYRLQSRFEHVEDISLDPDDLVCDAVDFGVMLGTHKGFGVLFDGEDLLPAAGQGESDGIATCTCKGIDEDGLIGRGGSNMFRDLAMGGGVSWRSKDCGMGKGTYVAIGSGVIPNHALSVIQMPSSYAEKMSYLCCQYLRGCSVLGAWAVSRCMRLAHFQTSSGTSSGSS